MSISEGDGVPQTGFRCRTCGSTKLIETMKDVVVTSECSITEGGVEYHDQTNEDGEVVGWMCDNGHNVMIGPPGNRRVVTDPEELVQLFGDEPILSHEELVALVADRLMHLSAEELITEYERVFPATVLTYLQDSMYVLKKREM